MKKTGFITPMRASHTCTQDRGAVAGFTFVETLIVVIIITLLVTVITSRLATIARRTRETTTKSNLYTLQRAIRNYYFSEGDYPQTLQDLVTKNYIQEIPTLYLGNHNPNAYYIIGSTPTDSGRWLYNPQNGEIRVDCTHKDSDGNIIYSWQY